MEDKFDKTPEEDTFEEEIKASESQDATYTLSVARSKRRKEIGVALIALAVVVALIISVMTTYSLTKKHYDEKIVAAYLAGLASGDDKLTAMDEYFTKLSYYDINSEELIEQALKAYVKATGDRYAAYYNAEEYKQFLADNSGNSVGIGVYINYAEEENAVRVLRVMDGSPANDHGLMAGDLIVSFKNAAGETVNVSEVGYEAALEMMRGKVGDVLTFTVKRYSENKTDFELKDFAITLRQYTTDTVDYRVCSTDASVGIVSIYRFDASTPRLFKEAMNSLRQDGIEKIIFDIRDNGGGDLYSISAVLSYFHDVGEVILSVKTKGGEEDVYLTRPVTYSDSYYKDCNVSSEEIGMYKGGKYAVLVNGGTASAAELFAANFRDCDWGVIVGEKTYGKGVMQTTYAFGEGAIKLTTKAYFPPCNENYDGIGIVPLPEYTCELSEEASKINVYMRDDAIDNQIQAAVAALNK